VPSQAAQNNRGVNMQDSYQAALSRGSSFGCRVAALCRRRAHSVSCVQCSGQANRRKSLCACGTHRAVTTTGQSPSPCADEAIREPRFPRRPSPVKVGIGEYTAEPNGGAVIYLPDGAMRNLPSMRPPSAAAGCVTLPGYAGSQRHDGSVAHCHADAGPRSAGVR
jgi:hypothetical protein